MAKYDIVLVRFPFDDFSQSKVRPALCLTGPIDKYDHVVVAFITSRIPDDAVASDVILDVSNPLFPSTGLRVSSAVRLHRLITIPQGIVRRKLGVLPFDLHEIVRKGLLQLFE